MEKYKNDIVDALKQELNWNLARINFIVLFILVLFKISTTELSQKYS